MTYIRLPIRTLVLILVLFLPSFFITPETALARNKISLVRDAEIENTIRAYATPLFQVAGLEPSSINIYLVNDKTLNAFVAGGQKLFLNTGLLMRSENAGQIIGVIAHETGHIAGGHLSRTRDAMKNRSAHSILAMILGGAATIGGRGDVGAAIIAGSQQSNLRSFLMYSRTQEGAADAAAMRYLDATRQSSEGMLEFFQILGDQELLSVKRQDPYYRSHPLTTERINRVRNHITKSPYTTTPKNEELEERHRRMKAKLYAFLNPPTYTFRKYKKADNSLEARYAKSIAYYRKADLEKAIPLIDSLLDERPNDPYFHELKGQMLFENAHIREALPFYEKAVALKPDSGLMRRDLARVQIELKEPAYLKKAIPNLQVTLADDRLDPFTWRLLATAYGQLGMMGESSLALGEEALLRGKPADAKFHAGRAEKLLKKGSTGWIQAQDIKQAANSDKGK